MKINKGITLISLVITIIILLILAGITINQLTGENGILTRANDAKETNLIAKYKEDLNLIILDEVSERKIEIKEEIMAKSLEAKICEKKWVKTVSASEPDKVGTQYLSVTSEEEYEFIIEVDNTNETAVITSTSNKPGEQYTITYNANGGKGSQEQKNVKQGWSMTLKENTYTKTDYVFVGWCEDAEGTGKKYLPGSRYTPTRNLTLYAIWSYNIATITFSSNGGIGSMESQNVTKGADTQLPQNTFTKENYKFVKWNTNAEGTGTSYENLASINITENITLYAIWKEDVIDVSDIVNLPSSYYGATVTGYTCSNSSAVNSWKIFYAGKMGSETDSHIYLIADYVEISNLPSKGSYSLNVSGAYKGYFTDILNAYSGSSDITDSRIKSLNNDYFNAKGYSSTNNNMKAVAYMLDKSIWASFTGNNADYAIRRTYNRNVNEVI